MSESLAKLLYSRLFDEVGKRINAHIVTVSKERYDAALADAVEQNPDAVEPAYVSFMDLFGFEGTNRNGVQQFFVNYARWVGGWVGGSVGWRVSGWGALFTSRLASAIEWLLAARARVEMVYTCPAEASRWPSPFPLVFHRLQQPM